MATTAEPTVAYERVNDLLTRLHVPARRILLQPPPGTATEADALKRKCCELIDGTLVEKPMGWYESSLAMILSGRLYAYLATHDLGFLLGESGLVRVKRKQLRAADVAFISWDRFPNRVRPKKGALPLVPDLAVEVLSPGNTKKEMERKRKEYFAGGARLVWEANPEKEIVKVYTSPTEFITVDINGTLDGGDVLPGFALKMRDWFVEAGPVA